MNGLFASDRALFSLINGLPHTTFTDTVFKIISGMGAYGLVWIVMGVLLVIREERKDHRFIKPLVGTALSAFVISDLVIKPLVARPRPDPLFGAIIAGGELLSDYSFPSGHVTTAFALAAVLSYKEPRYRTAFYILATLIAFSRIYLGYHYPLDTVGGAVLGTAVGLTAVNLYKRYRNGAGKRSKPSA